MAQITLTLDIRMPKTIQKAEDVDLSWLSFNEASGSYIGNCCGQIVTMNELGGVWTASINGELVENEEGTAIDSWGSQEEAAQVVMAMCELLEDEGEE